MRAHDWRPAGTHGTDTGTAETQRCERCLRTRIVATAPSGKTYIVRAPRKGACEPR